MNSNQATRRLVPSPFYLFIYLFIYLRNTKTAPFRIKIRDFFADFQFSPPALHFFQFDPRNLAIRPL